MVRPRLPPPQQWEVRRDEPPPEPAWWPWQLQKEDALFPRHLYDEDVLFDAELVFVVLAEGTALGVP